MQAFEGILQAQGLLEASLRAASLTGSHGVEPPLFGKFCHLELTQLT